MVADTENKRGRPRTHDDTIYSIFPDKEKRTAQNMYFVAIAINALHQKPGDFFVTNKGNFRRQGIAEQIGRMKGQNGYSDEDCKRIAETAMLLYEKGMSVKAIERWIRTGRKTNEW